MQGQPWKTKMQDMLQTCQEELIKTTEMGKKMLTASKTNSCLHEAYEEIGILALKAINDGSLKWDNPKVNELIESVKKCEVDLEKIEIDLNKLKFKEEAESKN